MTTTTHIASSEIRSINDQGIFTGYAAVWNQPDVSGEIISPGAFKTTLRTRTNKLPVLFAHRSDEPIGIFRVVKEDSYGLYVEGELNLDTLRGRDALTLLKQGALTGLSIAFIPDSSTPNRDGSRTITKASLFEISLTPIPAQQLAQVTSVRSINSAEDEVSDQDLGCIIAALREFARS